MLADYPYNSQILGMHNRAKELIEKYKSGNCSPEELELLYAWFYEINGEHTLSEQELLSARESLKTKLKREITPKRNLRPLYKWSAAAAVLLAGFCYMFIFQGRDVYKALSNQFGWKGEQYDATVLLLANNKEINLSILKNNQSIEIRDAAIKVFKDENGMLHYSFLDSSSSKEEVSYSRLITATGEQSQITLSDSTKVWLNAKSSLKFPTRFSKNKQQAREVYLQGEGYFEVQQIYDAKYKINQRFSVKTEHQHIEVLGTAFNVSSYKDEPTEHTTLVHGKVRVSAADAQGLELAPGEQASYNGNYGFFKKAVSAQEFISWRTGEIAFENKDIYECMRILSRWYDIQIEYHGDFKGLKFGGSFSKQQTLQQVLSMFEATGDVKIDVQHAGGSNSKERRLVITN